MPNAFLTFNKISETISVIFFLSQKMKFPQGYFSGGVGLKAAISNKPLRKISQNMGFL